MTNLSFPELYEDYDNQMVPGNIEVAVLNQDWEQCKDISCVWSLRQSSPNEAASQIQPIIERLINLNESDGLTTPGGLSYYDVYYLILRRNLMNDMLAFNMARQDSAYKYITAVSQISRKTFNFSTIFTISCVILIKMLIAIVFALKTVQMSKMCQTMYRLDAKDVQNSIKMLWKQKKFIEKLILDSSKDSRGHSTPGRSSARTDNKLFLLQESADESKSMENIRVNKPQNVSSNRRMTRL